MSYWSKQILNAEDLLKYKSEMRQLYAAENRGENHKRLYINGNGNFIVVFNGQDIATTFQASKAVEIYNNL